MRNKHLGHGLRSYITKDTKDWASLLPSIQWGLNTLEQPGLGVRAYEILYSQKPRMPIDTAIIDKTMESGVAGFAQTYIPRWDMIRQVVENNIKDNKRRTEYYQNLKARPDDIREGDIVYKFIDGTQGGENAGVSHKLLPRYNGPWRVVRKFGLACELEQIATGKTVPTLINVNKLKKVKHCRTEL